MPQEFVSTGIAGLDEITRGGLPKNHAYLVQGEAGSGKTTLAFQFLLAGVRRGKKALYISILQSKQDIEEMAESHGWDISGIEIEILTSEALAEAHFQQQTLLPSSEVQLSEVIGAVEQAVDRLRPALVVFDSIEQFRLIAVDPVLYQQKILALLRLFDRYRTTSLFLHTSDVQTGFRTLAHGVITLDAEPPVLGNLRRYLRIEKIRNIGFAEGRFSYRIHRGGLEVFPPLPIKLHDSSACSHDVISSGNAELDTMLGGGLNRGTACLLTGASGTGKSSLAMLYAWAAAQRGEHVALFIFDERTYTLLQRARGMGMDLAPLIDQGLIRITQVDVGKLSAGEIAHQLRQSVEQHATRIVIIDSISGYLSAMPGEAQLLAHLHDLLTYLGQHDVLTLMVLTEHGLFDVKSDIDVSYISDTAMLLRHFEARGRVRLAISVIKKRVGGHERTIRELQIGPDGITVGAPLSQFEGILTGSPHYLGNDDELMD